MASERLISNHHLKIFKDSVPHEDSLVRVGWLYRDCTVEPMASESVTPAALSNRCPQP